MQTLLVQAGLWLYYLHICLCTYQLAVLWGTGIRTPSKDNNNNASSLETKQPFYVFSTPAFSSRIVNASFLLLALFCPRSQCFWKAASEWTIVSILRITSVGIQLKQICSVCKQKLLAFNLQKVWAVTMQHLLGGLWVCSLLQNEVLMTLIVLESRRVVIRWLLSTIGRQVPGWGILYSVQLVYENEKNGTHTNPWNKMAHTQHFNLNFIFLRFIFIKCPKSLSNTCTIDLFKLITFQWNYHIFHVN